MNATQLKKAIEYNNKEADEEDFTNEHLVRLVQFWQENHQLRPDGQAGPLTQTSIDADISKHWQMATPPPPPSSESQFVGGLWLPWDGPETKQPTSYKQAELFFGDPGKGKTQVNKAWFKQNIVELHGHNRLPGVPEKWYVKVHRMIEPYLREGLRRALISAPEYEIKRLGGFNFRHIRHDVRNPLSMHAYGVAFDIDPGENYAIQFKWNEKPPKAWSKEYYKFWPRGVPQAWVQALESCGFTWGNDWDSDGETDDHMWLDPMHFEWIARDGKQFEV